MNFFSVPYASYAFCSYRLTTYDDKEISKKKDYK